MCLLQHRTLFGAPAGLKWQPLLARFDLCAAVFNRAARAVAGVARSVARFPGPEPSAQPRWLSLSSRCGQPCQRRRLRLSLLCRLAPDRRYSRGKSGISCPGRWAPRTVLLLQMGDHPFQLMLSDAKLWLQRSDRPNWADRSSTNCDLQFATWRWLWCWFPALFRPVRARRSQAPQAFSGDDHLLRETAAIYDMLHRNLQTVDHVGISSSHSHSQYSKR